jgi:hypothetical protein
MVYDNQATAEAACDDLRCTRRLAPKNALIAKKTERHHGHFAQVLGRVHCRKRWHELQKEGHERRSEPPDQRPERHATIWNMLPGSPLTPA